MTVKVLHHAEHKQYQLRFKILPVSLPVLEYVSKKIHFSVRYWQVVLLFTFDSSPSKSKSFHVRFVIIADTIVPPDESNVN